LIQVVEEKLPNGAQCWIEAASPLSALIWQLVLQDHDDFKGHWIEKCCNKFMNPTGDPSDPKRDMVLRCQRIQQRIDTKSPYAILGVESD
jgi:hypothetical protein